MISVSFSQWAFSNRRRASSLAAAALCCALLLPAIASADLLVYEPFNHNGGPADYPIGEETFDSYFDPVGGLDPATGPTAFYSSGWIPEEGAAQVVNQGSLKYPGFPRTGGRVTDGIQFDCCSNGRNGREIAGGLGFEAEPRTIYQSFLINFGDQGTDDENSFGKRGYEMWNGGVGDSFLAIDLFVNHFISAHEFTLSLTSDSGSVSQLLNEGGLTLANMAGVHLIVFKFEFNPADPVNPLGTLADDDTVTLFLDPTDSIEANHLPVASLSVNASDLLITHHGLSTNFTFSGSGHHPAAIDEMRWGDTFEDVTPFVPEPSSLILFGLGGMGALGPFRRRPQA